VLGEGCLDQAGDVFRALDAGGLALGLGAPGL